MERSGTATPEPTSSANGATDRRRSGRTVHKPVLLQEDPNVSRITNGNGKRKRTDLRDEEMADNNDGSDRETSHEDSDGDPDEEELREKNRRPQKAKKAQSKPAAKKPKTTHAKTTKLAVRPAANGFKKPPRPKKPRARANFSVADDSTGLYCRSSRHLLAYATLTCLQRRSSRKDTVLMQSRQIGSRATSSIILMPCVT